MAKKKEETKEERFERARAAAKPKGPRVAFTRGKPIPPPTTGKGGVPVPSVTRTTGEPAEDIRRRAEMKHQREAAAILAAGGREVGAEREARAEQEIQIREALEREELEREPEAVEPERPLEEVIAETFTGLPPTILETGEAIPARGAERLAIGAGLAGAAALTAIAIGGGGAALVSKAALAIGKAKVAMATKATAQVGLATKMKTTLLPKLLKYGALGYGLITERRVSNLDTALSQIRETFTVITGNVGIGAFTVEEGYDALDELEDNINSYERRVKEAINISPVSLISDRLTPVMQRIKKLKTVMIGARRMIAKIEIAGELPTGEELTIIMTELNRQLNAMPSESKFLGII